MSRPGVVSLALLVSLLAMPAAAGAAFPGAPGEIVVSEGSDVVAVPPRGGDERIVVNGRTRSRSIAVSPDGRTIAYTTTGYGRGPAGNVRYFTRFLLKDTHGSGTGRGRSIWPRAGRWYVHSIAFAAGGNRLIYSSAPEGSINPSGDFELFSVKLDGTGKIRLTNNRVDDFDPASSPDGRWVAFSRADPGKRYYSDDGVAIFRMRPVGGKQQRLTSGRFADTEPDYSPNGRRIAFSRYRPVPVGQSGLGRLQIWVMNRIGRVEHRWLTSETNIDLTEPVFSPAGNAIAAIGFGYYGGQYHRSDLYVLGGNGRLRKVSDSRYSYGYNNEGLDWGPAPGTGR